jgi:putative oxidoreductase
MTAAVSVGLLLLRLFVGLAIAAHGAQKAFGWFGGAGFSKMSAGLERQGLRPGALWTIFAVLGELGGGLSLAFGLLTPLGAAGVIGAMLMAITKTHWNNGFFNSKRGIEYPTEYFFSALALGFTGPGDYSLDHLLGINLPLWVFLVLGAMAVITTLIGLTISGGPLPPSPAAPTPPPAQKSA